MVIVGSQQTVLILIHLAPLSLSDHWLASPAVVWPGERALFQPIGLVHHFWQLLFNFRHRYINISAIQLKLAMLVFAILKIIFQIQFFNISYIFPRGYYFIFFRNICLKNWILVNPRFTPLTTQIKFVFNNFLYTLLRDFNKYSEIFYFHFCLFLIPSLPSLCSIKIKIITPWLSVGIL